ncbi:hypothetical protein D5086_017433 [Populus alba]|uniref:Uncharacterized protein n=1 Tax=Populus alba TaxID=43335 RepID=A0ACC4BYJ2_POPAL
MAKNKWKGKAPITRGKSIRHPSGSDEQDHDSSYVLALCAPEPILWTRASSPVPSSVAPSLVCKEGLVATAPTSKEVTCHLEAIPNPLEAVTVEDCSNDDPLVAALLDEEHLDFSFSEDDGEGMSPPVPLSDKVPPCSSGGPPPSSSKVPAGDHPSTITAAGWVTVESRRKAHKSLRKSSKGQEASAAGMEVNVNPSVCAGMVNSPSLRESTISNAVTRPSSRRENPMLEAEHPIDPHNRKCSHLLTFTDNRRSSPPRVSHLGEG